MKFSVIAVLLLLNGSIVSANDTPTESHFARGQRLGYREKPPNRRSMRGLRRALIDETIAEVCGKGGKGSSKGKGGKGKGSARRLNGCMCSKGYESCTIDADPGDSEESVPLPTATPVVAPTAAPVEDPTSPPQLAPTVAPLEDPTAAPFLAPSPQPGGPISADFLLGSNDGRDIETNYEPFIPGSNDEDDANQNGQGGIDSVGGIAPTPTISPSVPSND